MNPSQRRWVAATTKNDDGIYSSACDSFCAVALQELALIYTVAGK